MFFDSNNVSIGEFKTKEEAMKYPLRGCWCVNREENNLFDKYKQQGYRLFIICSWNRHDTQRYVVAIVGHHQVRYWNIDDIPMDTIKNEYEQSIGIDAENALYNILHQQPQPQQLQENKQYIKNTTMRKRIRINESQLRQIIKESIKKVLSEGSYYTIYGKLSTNQYQSTYDNPDEQSQWKQDNIEMLSQLSDEKFMKYYNNRMAYDDPDIVDAIYREYTKRYKEGRINEEYIPNVYGLDFDDTPQGQYKRLAYYANYIKEIEEASMHIKELAGKALTGDTSDSIDSRAWDFCLDLQRFIEEYGLNYDINDYKKYIKS